MRVPDEASSSWTQRPLPRWLGQVPAVLAGLALICAGWRIDARWFARHVLLPSFYDSLATRALLPGIRLGLFGVGATLLLIVRPWLRRRVVDRSIAALSSGALRLATAVVVSLGVCELVLQHGASHAQWREIAVPTPDLRARLCEPHPRYGWWPRPSTSAPVTVGARTVEFAIDAEHDRAPSSDSVSDLARPSILFAGESVTIGTGVRYEESFPARAAAALGLQAVNLAAPGYGTDQAYLRLVDALPRYRQPVAVVTMFLPGMLGRNFQGWRPHLELGADRKPLVVPPRVPAIESKLVDLVTEKLPFWSEGAIERSLQLTRALLADTAARARARGATPLFVVFLWAEPPPLAERADSELLHELLDAQGLSYVVVESDPRNKVPGDGHPDAQAHAQLADAIVAALRPAR
jgi:hypothetical protein